MCDRCEDRELSNDEMGWCTIDPDAFSVVPGCRWDGTVVWPLHKRAYVAGGGQSRIDHHTPAGYYDQVTHTAKASLVERRWNATIIAWVHDQVGRGRINKYVIDHTGSRINRTVNSSNVMYSVCHGCLAYLRAIVHR